MVGDSSSFDFKVNILLRCHVEDTLNETCCIEKHIWEHLRITWHVEAHMSTYFSAIVARVGWVGSHARVYHLFHF